MNTPEEYITTRSKEDFDQPASPSVNQSRETLFQDGEIDLFDIIRKIWDRRKIIIASVLVFLLFGILVAIVSPEEYTSEVVLMPQSSSSSSSASGLLRQFGGLAGINLGETSSGTIGINLYPDITQSTPFFLHMIDQPIFVSNMDTTVVLSNYVVELIEPPVTDHIKRYTIGLPKLLINLPLRILGSFKEKPKVDSMTPADNTSPSDTLEKAVADHVQSIIRLDGREIGAIGKLRQRIETSIEDNGMLRVSATMPDPYAAAQVTELAVNFLTQYLIEYKTEKSKSNLEFLEEQYEQAQAKYFQSQQKLAQFRDRNNNIVSATAQTELERLENENRLTFQVYQGLAQQLEQARITVQEETPMFKVLEPIQVPLSTSAPNRELTIFIYIFLGLFVGFSIVILSIIYQYIKPKFVTTNS